MDSADLIEGAQVMGVSERALVVTQWHFTSFRPIRNHNLATETVALLIK
jgi:hypothetical protein